MGRINNIYPLRGRTAGASAGTTYDYRPVGNRPFQVDGFGWIYESAEANTDNTLDFVIDYTEDGSAYTAIFTNGNPCGLLDSAAPLVALVNKGNAAASGGAAVAVTAPTTRVPAHAVIRFTHVRAGTGTVPAVQMWANGRYV